MSDDDVRKLIGRTEEKEMEISAFVGHIAETHGDFLRGLTRDELQSWVEETHGDVPCEACLAMLGAHAVVHSAGAG